MIAPLIAFSLVGLFIFYVQNLVFFPYVHLRLLALLLFYVGLRPSLALTLALSLVLGCLQDSYATTPFGAPFGGVPGAGGHGPVFPAPPAPPAVGFPGLGQSGRPGSARGVLAARHLHAGLPAPFSPRPDHGARMEILGTAALGPLMHLLVQGVEDSLRRLGWRPRSEPMPYQPFGE